MRYSKQSEEVLNTVLNSNNHPDAKEIYELVKLKIPNVSLGTVYRNLNTLAKEGLIRKIELDDGNDRFDKTLCLHNHLKCTKCGKVIDITPKLDQKEIKEIEKTGKKNKENEKNSKNIEIQKSEIRQKKENNRQSSKIDVNRKLEEDRMLESRMEETLRRMKEVNKNK